MSLAALSEGVADLRRGWPEGVRARDEAWLSEIGDQSEVPEPLAMQGIERCAVRSYETGGPHFKVLRLSFFCNCT